MTATRCLLPLALVLLTPTVAAAEGPVAAPSPVVVLQTFDSPITAEQVRPHVEFLASGALRGRSGREARVAAEYIRDHFERHGLEPLFEDGYFQEIPGHPAEDGERTVIGRNVGGWIRGSDPVVRDEVVIISAHYDHLGVRNGQIYHGADDNASGVSMMLEVARVVAAGESKPRRSIAFVGFDLEEHMLWGSRWFVAHPPWKLEQVKLFITADMIGRSLGNLPLPTVFVMGSEKAPALRTVLDDVGEPRGLEVARLGIDLIGTRSDYGPFRDRKVPFLFFSTGEHPDYHTPQDVPERIDYEKVAGISGLVLHIGLNVANADDAPVWTDEVLPCLDEVAAVHRVTTLLLEETGERKLTAVQRLLVSQVEIKTRQLLAGGTLTQADRAWLIRMSQLLLISVF